MRDDWPGVAITLPTEDFLELVIAAGLKYAMDDAGVSIDDVVCGFEPYYDWVDQMVEAINNKEWPTHLLINNSLQPKLVEV